jgi:hypothetical protein
MAMPEAVASICVAGRARQMVARQPGRGEAISQMPSQPAHVTAEPIPETSARVTAEAPAREAAAHMTSETAAVAAAEPATAAAEATAAATASHGIAEPAAERGGGRQDDHHLSQHLNPPLDAVLRPSRKA